MKIGTLKEVDIRDLWKHTVVGATVNFGKPYSASDRADLSNSEDAIAELKKLGSNLLFLTQKSIDATEADKQVM